LIWTGVSSTVVEPEKKNRRRMVLGELTGSWEKKNVLLRKTGTDKGWVGRRGEGRKKAQGVEFFTPQKKARKKVSKTVATSLEQIPISGGKKKGGKKQLSHGKAGEEDKSACERPNIGD